MTNENVPNMIEYCIKNKGGIIIRKVELRMNEQQKYEVIKKLVDTNGSKERASIKLFSLSIHMPGSMLRLTSALSANLYAS
jgi:hypothetical protein